MTSGHHKRDASLRHKGYYEKLDNVNRFSTQVWEATAQVPKDIVGLAATAAWNKRGDFIVGDIKPNASIMFYRLPLTTNRWGMRDKDYEVAKAPGTYRIALLGPSHVMGVGVPDGKTFEAQLEDRLNRELAGKPYEKYEVLNFGVPAFAMTQQAAMLEDRVWQFNPDVVVVTIYPEVLRTAQEHLGNVAFNYIPIPPALDSLHAILDAAGVSDPGKSGFPVPSAGLRRILGAAGISTRMPWKEGGTRIYGHREAIVSYAIRSVARSARAHGAVPVLLALDQAEPEPTDQEPMHPFFDTGEKSGMLVLNLFDVYDGHDKTPLRVAEWDNHPNVAGSKLIADRLFDELQKHRVRLHLNQVPQR